MSKNAYEILGVSPNADMQTIERQYYALRDRYREEMYQEGAVGKAAARKLNEIEQAYSDICAGRATVDSDKESAPDPIVVNDPYASVNDEEGASSVNDTSGGATSSPFAIVKSKMDAGDLKGAQSELDAMGKRDSEWHYYQAMIYYKKKWTKEAVNQMEMACQMEPSNTHYAKVLERLKEKQTDKPKGYNEQTQGQQQNNGYQRSYQERDAREAEDGCCRFCETLICLNCMCDCCCRG